MRYRFADCTLDTQLHTLHRAGQSTRLAPKVLEVLCYLLEHRDRVVSKQQLCDQVWEGRAISDAALESCLRAVRIAVGDSGQAQRIIQAQRGYGYRFVAAVTVEPSDSGTEEPPSASPVPLEPLADSAVTLPSASPMLPPRPGPLLRVRLCAACQHTNDEHAVFCAACGTPLRQRCAHCGQDVPYPAVFCTACGQPLARPAAARPTPTPAGQAERKPVTMLCCTVAATTAQGRPLDLDALHSILLELHALARDVVGQYGGRLHPVMGERLMAMFGVPVAHEDDAWRAVHVALELRRRLVTVTEDEHVDAVGVGEQHSLGGVGQVRDRPPLPYLVGGHVPGRTRGRAQLPVLHRHTTAFTSGVARRAGCAGRRPRSCHAGARG